jgi:hypothetical protein
VWGVDKTSGMEGYTTQLKEWTVRVLLEIPEEEKKEVKEDERRIKDRSINIGRILSESPEGIQGDTLQTQVKRVSISQDWRENFLP